MTSTHDSGDGDSRPTGTHDVPGDAANQQADSPGRPRRIPFGRLARAAGIYLTFGILVSLLTEVTLEAARTGWDWAYVGELLSQRAGVMAATVLVTLLLAVVLLAVSGRMWLTAGILLTVATLLGAASHLKYVERREPIYPQDLVFLLQPRFLLDMVQPRLLWLTLLGLVPVALFCWGLDRLFRLWLRRKPVAPRDRSLRTTVVASRVGAVALSLGLLSSLLQFNQVGNPWRQAFEASGAQWGKASQLHNYAVNGFVAAFLYNLNTPAMTRPAGYSRAAMEQIVREYTADAEKVNKHRSPHALDGVNVVSVLSESFTDPMRLRGMQLDEDPIPRTRALMETLPHGLMLSPKTGGGTSSMEFETLTGMSLSQFNPTMDTPYQMLVPDYATFPSAVEMFRQMGHTPVAVHPYFSGLYERDKVYPILGFADFIDRSRMDRHLKYENNPFISDGAAFRQVLDEIGDHDEPLFVNLVTMQNHTPYDGKYADPIGVEGLSPEGADMVGQYSRGLSYSDRAIPGFIRNLSRSDEKTLVVFYGDHEPAGIPDELFDDNPRLALHQTPFFLYSNYGKVKAESLPTTSPVFFLPHLFDLAGAPLSPYYALLEELERHISAMEHGWMLGPDGGPIDPKTLSGEARQVLRDYRLVQYDLAVGKRYSEEMLYPSPAGNLEASGPPD
jgi:phosphoglycerol transferase MdoB-like AlkP superfamily enzyme